jgi:hypothetical protein
MTRTWAPALAWPEALAAPMAHNGLVLAACELQEPPEAGRQSLPVT